MNKVLGFFKNLFKKKDGLVIDLTAPDEVEVIEVPVVDSIVEAAIEEPVVLETPVEEVVNAVVTEEPEAAVKELVEELVKDTTIELQLGEYGFKRYKSNSKVGQYGIVIFRDTNSKVMELGRTVKLAEYLSSISARSIKSGRFGRGPQAMKKVEVFYHEVPEKEMVSKAHNAINKLIYK